MESDTRRVIHVTKPVISYGQEKDGIVIAVNLFMFSGVLHDFHIR
jgi:hypothetical protein